MVRRIGFALWSGLIVLAFCAGCGGGGGSPPSTATPVPPPPPPPPIVEPAAPTINYVGSRQPITVDQSNAAQLAYRAFQVRAVTQLLESFWVDAPSGAIKNEATNVGQFSGIVDLTTEVDSSGRGYVQGIFRNFSDDADVTVDGRYLQRFRPESGTASGMEFSFAGPGSLEFDNLTFRQGNSSSTFHGVLRISGVNSDVFTVNAAFTNSPSGDNLFFENAEIRFSTKVVNNSDRPAVDISGAVFDFNEGGVDFSSLGPIPDLAFQEAAGYLVGGAGGGIQLLSDGPATHVRPISFAFVTLVMDLDGDGSPEAARRYSWPELAGESLVETSVFPGPIANAGNRRTPSSGEPVKIHALFSHDDDGDWLSFEWRLIAKPAESVVSLDAVASDPLFEMTPDVPGDYVLGLRATDGESTSEVALLVRHAPSEPPNSYDEPTGGLEVVLPIVANSPTLIDGRSAMNWPYSQVAPAWIRTGFGVHSFSPTGNLASIYSNATIEGLNEIRFTHAPELAGAPNADAQITMAVGSPIFETEIELAGDANAYDIHKADFDNDGSPDLILRTGTPGNERILILHSTTDGLLPGQQIDAGVGELSVGDIDGDGLIDILNTSDSGALIFYQQPDHSLSNPISLSFPASGCASFGGATDIAIADVNGDFQMDLIAVHPCDDAVIVWLQNVAGTFEPPLVTTFNNHRIQTAAFGDINGDGRSDAVLSLSATTTAFEHAVASMIAQPNGTLVQRDFFVNTGLKRPGVSVGDINGDARHDLVIVGGQDISIAYQADDGTLSESVIYSDPTGASFDRAISLLDLNDDQLADLVFCDSGPSMHLLMQEQNNVFTHVYGPRSCHQELGQSQISASLDVNLDGISDLVAITKRARGAIDERALLAVFLQDVHSYPAPVVQ